MIKNVFAMIAIVGFSALARSAPQWDDARSAPQWDQVSTGNVEMKMPNLEAVLLETVEDLKGTFELYEPKLGKGEKIVIPLRVTGSKERPSLFMRIQKCVSFYCQEADLDADVVSTKVNGSCRHNWIIDLNIAKSSQMVVDHYDRLKIEACYNQTNETEGTLALKGYVRRGANYSQGQIQGIVLDVLKAQFPPMSEALKKNLRKHASTPNVRLILRQRLLK